MSQHDDDFSWSFPLLPGKKGFKTEKKKYETSDCLLVFCYFYANTAPLKQHRMLLMDLKSTSYFKVHNFNFCSLFQVVFILRILDQAWCVCGE